MALRPRLLRPGQRDLAAARGPDAVGRRACARCSCSRCTRWRWPASTSTRPSATTRGDGCSAPGSISARSPSAPGPRRTGPRRGCAACTGGYAGWSRSRAPYEGSDPELLLWVHCGEIDSFLSVGRRAGLRLSDADADRYVAEQVTAAALVGIPRGLAPRSVAELATYFERMRSRAADHRGGPGGRPLRCSCRRCRLLVQLATPARPAWLAAAGLAFATLPPWARRLYGLPGLPTTDLGASLAVRGLRPRSRTLPAAAAGGAALPAGEGADGRHAGAPARGGLSGRQPSRTGSGRPAPG